MMKKFTAHLLLGALLLSFVPAALASDEAISFYKALTNFEKVHDYKQVQSIYGNAEFEEYEDHVSMDYRISLNGAVDGGNRTDTFNRLSVTLNFVNHNEATDSTPFKKMTVQANGEIITFNQEDLYFKLNNFSIGLDEPLPFALMDIENVTAMADLYKGTWYHTSTATLVSENMTEQSVDIEEYKVIEKQLKEDPKKDISELTELILSDANAGLSENEKTNILEGVQKALEVKLFSQRDLMGGRNKGFTFFNLNKGAIMKLMNDIAALFGESMSASETAMIRSALGKISLSGMYRIEDTYGIFDALHARLKLRDIGPLKNLELNYRYKVAELNKENSIKAPSDFQEWQAPFSEIDEGFNFEDEWPEELPEEIPGAEESL